MENNSQKVSEMVFAMFPGRSIPSKRAVQNIVHNFESKGTVINNCYCLEQNNYLLDGRAEVNNADLELLLHLEEHNGISTRLLGKTVGKHYSAVQHNLNNVIRINIKNMKNAGKVIKYESKFLI